MTQEETVFRTIEKAILEQRLPPGTRLREVQLAAIFDVKRGMIRKVLSHLTNRKLVDHKPHSGAQVSCPSLEDAKDLFATRQLLENSVIKTLCQKLTKEQVMALRDHIKQEKLAYLSSDTQKGVRLSAGFHKLLAEFAGNQIIAEFLNDIINRTPLVMLDQSALHLSGQPAKGCLNHDHSEIINALELNNYKKAAKLMRQHLCELEYMFNVKTQENSLDLSEILTQ